MNRGREWQKVQKERFNAYRRARYAKLREARERWKVLEEEDHAWHAKRASQGLQASQV